MSIYFIENEYRAQEKDGAYENKSKWFKRLTFLCFGF